MAQVGGHGVPAKAVEVHANAREHGLLNARNHVRVAGDEHEVRDLLLHGGDDHVRDETRVHALLRAAVAPLDELACAQLHAVTGAQRALVAVWAGIRDAVVPVLTLNFLVQLVFDHGAHGVDDLGKVNL